MRKFPHYTQYSMIDNFPRSSTFVHISTVPYFYLVLLSANNLEIVGWRLIATWDSQQWYHCWQPLIYKHVIIRLQYVLLKLFWDIVKIPSYKVFYCVSRALTFFSRVLFHNTVYHFISLFIFWKANNIRVVTCNFMVALRLT